MRQKAKDDPSLEIRSDVEVDVASVASTFRSEYARPDDRRRLLRQDATDATSSHRQEGSE